MADRIVVMREGRVEQTGGPLELYDQPANLFVAGFIGSPAMNMLKGSVEIGRRTGFSADNGTFVPLPPSPALEGLAGRALVIGIRPEHLHIAGDDRDGFEVAVRIVEPTGSETQVTAIADGAEIIALFRERQTVHQGDTLRLVPMLYHLFDATSGERCATVTA